MNHYLIREIANRIGIGSHDVLDAVLAIGVKRFVHEGQLLGRDYLPVYLAMRHFDCPVPMLEVSLTPGQEIALAKELQVEVAEILFDDVRS